MAIHDARALIGASAASQLGDWLYNAAPLALSPSRKPRVHIADKLVYAPTSERARRASAA